MDELPPPPPALLLPAIRLKHTIDDVKIFIDDGDNMTSILLYLNPLNLKYSEQVSWTKLHKILSSCVLLHFASNFKYIVVGTWMEGYTGTYKNEASRVIVSDELNSTAQKWKNETMIYLDFFAMTKSQTDRECRLSAGYCASKNDDEKILTTHNMLQAITRCC